MAQERPSSRYLRALAKDSLSRLLVRSEERGRKHTPVHGPQHADDETVNSVTLLDLRNEGRDTTFVVCGSSEVSEDEFLERVDIVLQVHQVHDCFESD
jgi:hypothetical protein